MEKLDLAELQKRKILYHNLMQEVRWRLDSIGLIEGQLGKSLNTLQHFIANETYLLQLRMIFESIALGCMIVHGDIPITKTGKMTKFYQADILLKNLTDAHPEFFPTPVNFFPDPMWLGAMTTTPRKPVSYLTKSETIRLYGKFGEYLHRGKMSSFVARQHDALKPLGKEIGDTWRNCVALLGVHKIALKDSPLHLVCHLYPTVAADFYHPDPAFWNISQSR